MFHLLLQLECFQIQPYFPQIKDWEERANPLAGTYSLPMPPDLDGGHSHLVATSYLASCLILDRNQSRY